MQKSCSPEHKFWKVMKMLSLQAMIAVTLCSLALAHDNFAQVLDKKLTITLEEVPIEKALETIERLANVKFFYSVDQLKIKNKISIRAVDTSLRYILEELFRPHNIQFKVHEKRSTITLKKVDHDLRSEGEPENKRQFIGKSVTLRPAARITGTVTDASSGLPMAGVNVIIKGTTEGTTTNSEGQYTVFAEDHEILVFSFIGYATFEVAVEGRSTIDIQLDEDITSLKTIEVNAGYYKTTKELQTTSITKIESADIQRQPISNPVAALQGRVPGLEITQSTGVPGGNFTVRIRGTNSIGNGNDPLYIIDGVPYTSSSMAFNITSNALLPAGTSPLNNINPNDIESIEILKDAGATAIYGSRGANGVILITTKKGKRGAENVNINFYRGIGKVTSKIDLLNTAEYLEMRREAIVADGYLPYLEDPAFDFIWPDVKTWDDTRYTDWQDELIGGTATTTDAQISASGGTGNTQYFLGGNFHEETTVFPGDNADRRIATHLNISNSSFNEKLSTSVSLNYSVNNSDLIKQDLTQLALTLPPNGPALYDDNGDLNWGPAGWTEFFPNPLAFLETNYESSTKNLLANLLLSYSILKNLQIKTSLGYTDINMEAVTTTPVTFYFPPARNQYKNESNFGRSNFQNWIAEPQLSWSPKIGATDFEVLLGTSFLTQMTEGLAQFADGFPNEALMKNIGAASDIYLSESTFSEYRYHAVFGRVNFTHKEKYIINLTGRRDGSSRFGPGKQFASFGAVGAAWIFTKENQFKSSSFLSFGKIRASFGVTGNDQIGNYQYLNTYRPSLPYQGNASLTPVRLSNPEFSWETNRKLEIGLDFGLIRDRIYTSISHYRNTSSNQLVGFALPPTTGFRTIQGNFPAIVRNTGVEIEINSINIENQNVSWSTSLNFTAPRNKLVEFPNLEESAEYADRLVVGEPLTIRKTFRYLGVDPETGLYQVEDVNQDGIFNNEDKQVVNFVGRYYFGGLQNTFRYKALELDVLFQFVKQTGYNYMFGAWPVPGGQTNQPKFITQRWQQPGDITTIQRYTTTDPGATTYTHFAQSDQVVGDASFIRLKNISLSYAFAGQLLNKLHLQNARIFFLGQNVLTITNYTGMDPENQNVNSSLPPLKVFTGGFQLTF